MLIEVVREEPLPPAVKEVVVRLTPTQFHDIARVIQVAGSYAALVRILGDMSTGTIQVDRHCSQFLEAAKAVGLLSR